MDQARRKSVFVLPPEIARTLPVDLLKLMGYSTMGGWGRVGDWLDPLDYLLGTKTQIVESDRLPGVYQRTHGDV